MSRTVPPFAGRILRMREFVAPYWQTVSKSGSVHLMSANLFNQALGFISSLFVVRFLKPEELGEARVITTYVGYVQLVGCFGLTTSVLTFVPRTDNPAIRRHWLRMTLLIVGVTTTFVALVGAWLSWHGILMSNGYTAYWFRWSLLGGLATAASSVMISFYQAERAVRELAGIQSAVRIAALLVCVGGAWVGGFDGYMIAGIVSAFVMLGGLAVTRIGKNVPPRPAPLPAGYMRVAGLALVGALLWTAGRTADVIILDRLATDRVQFGCYTLALAISGILAMINMTLQVVATPFFSAHHDDSEWTLRNARKWQCAGTLLAAVMAILLFGCGLILIHRFYGAAYSPATYYLIPLLLAQCLLATFHIQAGALLGKGLVKINTMVGGVVVPLSVLITLLLARLYGIPGAAWGQVVSAAVYAALQSVVGWRALSSVPKPRPGAGGEAAAQSVGEEKPAEPRPAINSIGC